MSHQVHVLLKKRTFFLFPQKNCCASEDCSEFCVRVSLRILSMKKVLARVPGIATSAQHHTESSSYCETWASRSWAALPSRTVILGGSTILKAAHELVTRQIEDGSTGQIYCATTQSLSNRLNTRFSTVNLCQEICHSINVHAYSVKKLMSPLSFISSIVNHTVL